MMIAVHTWMGDSGDRVIVPVANQDDHHLGMDVLVAALNCAGKMQV